MLVRLARKAVQMLKCAVHLPAMQYPFRARTQGGVRFVTAIDGSGNPTAGVYLDLGGNRWNPVGTQATKENFTPVDKQALLEQSAAIPIRAYNLKSQDLSVRHIGPVIQDFGRLGYGGSDTAINVEDAAAVALVAIQGLHEIIKQKKAEIEAL